MQLARSLFGVAVSCALAAPALADDITTFNVAGTGPEGNAYTGTVTITEGEGQLVRQDQSQSLGSVLKEPKLIGAAIALLIQGQNRAIRAFQPEAVDVVRKQGF